MNILFICAEVAPFVSVGGLSQVMYFLPRALSNLGHDVRIFTPKYGAMELGTSEGKTWKMHSEIEGLRVPISQNVTDEELLKDKKDYILCNIKSYRDKRKHINAYFLENREYYELRANVFGYVDDHIRFDLLSKGCLEWLLERKARRTVHAGEDNEKKVSAIISKDGKTNVKAIRPQIDQESEDAWFPDIIHCNDWHTGYLIELARKDTRYKQLLAKTAVVLTIHNFAFQGNYDFRFAKKEDQDTGIKPLASLLSPDLQKQNALIRGLLYADAINTVSPSHAIEILTPEYAEGLDNTLEIVKGKLVGILNGLDTEEFDPASDPIIKSRFTEKTFLKARKENKKDLQKLFLLPIDDERPLFAFSGRLASQKGVDLLIELIPHLFAERSDVQFIILGGGDDRFRNKLMEIQKLYPKQIGLHLRPDFRLPRKIFAGSDFFFVPSSYEPGGIVALEALRYGAVPIVRRTGGLNDIIMDFNPATGKGNGFSFTNKNAWSFYGSIMEALTIYKQPLLWKKLVLNCLRSDFSWEIAAKEYDDWYRQILEERKRATSPIVYPAYNTPTTG